MRPLLTAVALTLGGCALTDGLGGSGDGEADADTDIDTDADTDTDTGTDTGTDTASGTPTDLGDCFRTYQGEDVCENQESAVEECKNGKPQYEASTCDPVDQCRCATPNACYPAYRPDLEVPDDSTECIPPGSGEVDESCSEQDECEAGLFCVSGQVTFSGETSCQRPCDDPCDCPADQMCIGFLPPFCRPPDHCDVLNPDSCPPGRSCVLVPDIDQETWATFCLDGPLDGNRGDDCASVNSCRRGLGCIDGRCAPYCDGPEDCEAQETCTVLESVTGCDFEVQGCV